jgi:hypothetical protein
MWLDDGLERGLMAALNDTQVWGGRGGRGIFVSRMCPHATCVSSYSACHAALPPCLRKALNKCPHTTFIGVLILLIYVSSCYGCVLILCMSRSTTPLPSHGSYRYAAGHYHTLLLPYSWALFGSSVSD